jgi:hypothetical protein
LSFVNRVQTWRTINHQTTKWFECSYT